MSKASATSPVPPSPPRWEEETKFHDFALMVCWNVVFSLPSFFIVYALPRIKSFAGDKAKSPMSHWPK